MPKPLPFSLIELRRAVAAGDVSPAYALRDQHHRIGQDTWNCVTHTFDAVKTAPDPALPLAGVGVAHKDTFIMPGHQPLCGAASAPSFSEGVSPLVQRLNDAGATTLATLTMAEFASGVTGENANLALPVNPLGSQLAVGGSSSGSAVAVAAGLCYGSLGTDTAGSVRIPAATCGVVGLKPTNGVLQAQGCFPLAPSLDTPGVITRTALDAAVLFKLLLAPEQGHDVLSDGADVAQRPADGPLRIATVHTHPNRRFSAIHDVCDAISSVAKRFSDSPVQHHASLVELSAFARQANTILHVEAAATHFQRLRTQPSELSAITRAVVLPGAAIPSAWYALAQRQRDAMRTRFLDRYFASSDILLTPVLPFGVPPWETVLTHSAHFNSTALLALFSWTAFVNYLGLPAVVFPVGQDANGLPVSIQAIARPYNESLLLALAHQAERKHTETSVSGFRFS